MSFKKLEHFKTRHHITFTLTHICTIIWSELSFASPDLWLMGLWGTKFNEVWIKIQNKIISRRCLPKCRLVSISRLVQTSVNVLSYIIAQVYRLSAVHWQMTRYSQRVPGYLTRYSVSANEISFDKKSANQIVFQIRLGLEENDSPLHLVTSTGFLKA